MDAPPEPRRTFAIADVLLLFVGLSIGFAITSHFHEWQLRTQDFPEYAGRDLMGPVELLVIGASYGMAFAYPLLRIRDAWAESDRRRLFIPDVFGLWPAVLYSLVLTASTLRNPPYAVGILIVTLFVLLFPLGFVSVFLGIYYFNERTTWLDVFACATTTANAIAMLVALN